MSLQTEGKWPLDYVGVVQHPTEMSGRPLTHEMAHVHTSEETDVKEFKTSHQTSMFLQTTEDVEKFEYEEAEKPKNALVDSETADLICHASTETGCAAVQPRKGRGKKKNKKRREKSQGSEKTTFRQRGDHCKTSSKQANPHNMLEKREKGSSDRNSGKDAAKGRKQKGSQKLGGGDGDDSSDGEEKKEKGGQFGHYAGIPGNGLPFEEDDDDHTDFDDGFADDDDDDNDDDVGDEDENRASYCSENTDVSMSQIAQPTQSDVSMRSAHASSNFQRNSFHPDAGNAAEKKEVCILLDSYQTACTRYFERRCKDLNYLEREIVKRIANWVVHVSYKTDCNCSEVGCNLAKKHLEHLIPHQRLDCRVCERVKLSIFQHAKSCDIEDCPVYQCRDFKDMFRKAVSKRSVESTVLHTITPLWKKGQTLRQDLHYTFLSSHKLGKGKFGVVNRVWFYDLTKETEADLAVKMVKYDPVKEARVHERLREDHPNILSSMAIISFKNEMKINGCEDPIKGYILMELAECTLFHLKNSFPGHHFPLDDAIYYMAQIFDGLAYLHSKGIIHKDIKDLNILVTEGGQRIKLADWDSAVILEEEMTDRLPPQGTYGFAAPEVLESKPHSTAADIFSAAVTCIELCMGGQYRRSNETKEEYYARRARKMAKLERLHPDLHAVIARCLEVDHRMRPTALEVRNNPIFTLESNYKVQVPKNLSSQTSDPSTKIDPITFDDIAGDKGERVRSRVREIESHDDSRILTMMDGLPKKLPTENIPVSNDWVGNAVAPVEQMDYSS